MDTEKFLNHVTGQIQEAQLKLGFVREEIRLYYPASSLCRLLQIEYREGRELAELLEEEPSLADTALGKINFSLRKDNRIEVRVSREGVEYVRREIPVPPFLERVIRLFGENHHLTIEEICACFGEFNPAFVCKKMEPDADFDYVLYFPDGKPDIWYYCVRMEMGHTIYHRFLKEDLTL